MKRIVLALVLVVVMALPAMAQDVDVTFSGEFWGTYTAPSGGDSFFETFSPFSPSANWWDSHVNDYSFVTANGTVGNNLGFTYTYDVSFRETDQAFAAFLPGAGLVNEVRAGKFQVPIGLNEFVKTFSTGVAVLGRIGAFDYNLAYVNATDLADIYADSDDNALNVKVDTTVGAIKAGATFHHDADDLDIFGVDAATRVGPFGLKAEYLFFNIYGDFKERDLFLSGSYDYTDRTTFFVDYYNALFDGDAFDANKIGVSYKINDNASLRAMFVNGPIVGGSGFETALKFTF